MNDPEKAKGEISQDTAFDLLDALELALANSCRRADGRGKWTVADQGAHEAIQNAIEKARQEVK